MIEVAIAAKETELSDVVRKIGVKCDVISTSTSNQSWWHYYRQLIASYVIIQ